MNLVDAVPELLTCAICRESFAWRGIGRKPGRCRSCRARRSGRVISEPAVAGRETQRQAEEDAAIDAWARARAAKIKRRMRKTA